jgi:hypothetical protein
MRPKVIMVSPDSSKELKGRVYRLRYQIYVEEMKINVANEERMLHDKYDDYSTNFILEVNGEDIGTIRHTAKRDGPLELEDQHETWRMFISSVENNPQIICELTRFMVKRDSRGTRAALKLLYVGLLHCMRVGTYKDYFAAKTGKLSAYWKTFGARECITEPLPYVLGNHSLGLYTLVLFDFGPPWSVRRAITRIRYGLLRIIALISVPSLNALLRGRRGYKHKN